MPSFRYRVSFTAQGGSGSYSGEVRAASRAEACAILARRSAELGQVVEHVSLQPTPVDESESLNEENESMQDKEAGRKYPLHGNQVCRVFVYGTLKQQHGNNPLLQRGGATLLGRFALEGDYTMVSLGGFPGVVINGKKEEQTSPIYGEVYGISEECLHSLDLLEGHPNFYNRTRVATEYGRAWVYLLPRTFLDEDKCPIVTEGVWRPTEDEAKWIASQLPGESDGSDARAISAASGE